MEVPASNVPLATANGGAGGVLSSMNDLSIYFKGHRVNLVVSPEPSAPPDKPVDDLVADVNRVKDTVSAVEQVVRSMLEDKEAKVSKVNCYKVLSKYAMNQVKLRGLEAKVRVLEERLAQEKQQERPFSPSTAAMTPSSNDDHHDSHHFLKQDQQDEVARKAEKLQKLKALHHTPSTSPTSQTYEVSAGSIKSAASVSSHNQDKSASDFGDVPKSEGEGMYFSCIESSRINQFKASDRLDIDSRPFFLFTNADRMVSTTTPAFARDGASTISFAENVPGGSREDNDDQNDPFTATKEEKPEPMLGDFSSGEDRALAALNAAGIPYRPREKAMPAIEAAATTPAVEPTMAGFNSTPPPLGPLERKSSGASIANSSLSDNSAQDYGVVGVEDDLSETSTGYSANGDGDGNDDEGEDDEGSNASNGSRSFQGDASMAYSTRAETRSTYALQLRDSEIQRAVGNIVIKKHDPSLVSPLENKASYLPSNMLQDSGDDSNDWDDDDAHLNLPAEGDTGGQGSCGDNGDDSGYSEEGDRAPVEDASNSRSYYDSVGRDNEPWEDDRNANVHEDSNSSYQSAYDWLPSGSAPPVGATEYESDEDDNDSAILPVVAKNVQSQEDEEGALSESPPQESRPVEAEAPKKGRRQRKGSIAMITAPISAVANAGASVANAGASAVMKQAMNARNYVMPASMCGGGPAAPPPNAPDGAPKPPGGGRRQRKGSIAMMTAPVTAAFDLGAGVASGMGNMAIGMKNYVMPAGWDGENSGPAAESLNSPEAEDVNQAQSAEPTQEKKRNRKKKASLVLALPVAVVVAPIAIAASPVAFIVWQAKKKKKAKKLKKAAASAEGENAKSCEEQKVAKTSEAASKAGPLSNSQKAPPEARPEPEEDVPAVQLSDVQGVQASDPAQKLFVASLSDAREEPVVGGKENKEKKPEPILGEFETGELRALTIMGIVPTSGP